MVLESIFYRMAFGTSQGVAIILLDNVPGDNPVIGQDEAVRRTAGMDLDDKRCRGRQ